MTLGCGAVAGNITSDNIGPQHLINIKRLAYVVRKAEEAFEMPLDYNQAPVAPMAAAAAGGVDRGAITQAVERYLASRGIAVTSAGGPSCGCAPTPATHTPATHTPAVLSGVTSAAVASPAAQVVDRFLSRRSGSSSSGGYS